MKSTSHSKCDRESVRAPSGHFREKESDAFTNRVLEVLGDEPLHAFARRCGVGESTLRNIIKSGAWPRTDNLIAIADTANVNIEWLATGRGPKQRGSSTPTIPQAPPIPASIINIEDIHRLTLAIEAVEEGLGSIYSTIPADKRAKLVAAAYDLLGDTDQKDNVIKFIKLAA